MTTPASSDSITLLHISDMQFGRNHRFGRLSPLAPDANFDTLVHRLTDDLAERKKMDGLVPQIVVVSGDLAEWGLPKEFDDARQFLEQLAGFLGLPRDRVVIVPGNHDINRKNCEAYFAECSGDEKKPTPPFWPKWKHFAAMFEKFYQAAGPEYTVAQPWSRFEYPDLKVVVAGLNSTISEIHDLSEKDPLHGELIKPGHYGHFGWVGEEQLRAFARWLSPFKDQGWLRIGVVHHNFSRGAAADDENLCDADALEQSLGGFLNLLLHGHTHNARINRMANGVPILSTGSTALTKDVRPDEVPNQYQFIRIGRDGFERWARRFDPGQNRWIGDTRVSGSGNEWHTKHPVTFEAVDETFPAPAKKPTGGTRRGSRPRDARRRPEPFSGESDSDGGRSPDRELDRPESLFARVRRVCELRVGGAEVHPARDDEAQTRYLLVTVRDEMSTRQYPVGVCEVGISREEIDRFLRTVDAKYRAADRTLRSELVYAGPQAAPELIDHGKRQGVRVHSFIEYQGLIDFGNYLGRQTKRLEADPIYPPRLYVPQRMQYSLAAEPADAPPKGHCPHALDTMTSWLTDEGGRFVLVLANFGTGKSFLLRELARAGSPG